MVSSHSLASIMMLMAAIADAFTAPTTTRAAGGIAFSSLLPPPSALGASSSSDPVDVLSDYMTKSHEEKLRAIKSVEDKKNIEISVLKAEIERLKSSSQSSSTAVAAVPSPSNLESNTMDISEMQSKLASYQSFMAEYIVDSQNQKLAAVKEAESRVEKKFMEKIEKLLSLNGGGDDLGVNGIAAVATSPAAEAAAAISTIAVGGEQSLFQKRNNQILQAADANKSRWGCMEIERAKKEQMLSPPPLQSSSAAATVFDRRNDQVIASAAAGKSRWGGKEVERAMKNGVSVAVPAAATATLFDRRNAQVIASAAAGKSRWGGMEVERAMKNGVVVVGVNASGNASSSGGGQSRSDAVVTLEERVNLGARLLGK